MNKIYGYARSNRGKDGLTMQVEQLEKYARINKLSLQLYTDVSSGSQIGSQLQKLITDMPVGSKLITMSRTRLSRNSNDLALITNELRNKNIELVILNIER